ncbi:hypothetical protein L6164_000084 [Bauhinia variegata]|uniref:Uncharacterized protein n=1 Tax=Bauhinia variegata TaxID=167791 RepID=A0ACB9Q5J0_BAUVA|nr:hypothetical protein L6164_000084 [Bauhinia variegata]
MPQGLPGSFENMEYHGFFSNPDFLSLDLIDWLGKFSGLYERITEVKRAFLLHPLVAVKTPQLSLHGKHSFVRWIPPPQGFYKLNTDGSCIGNLGRADIKGVIRDATEAWVSGFMGSISQPLTSMPSLKL